MRDIAAAKAAGCDAVELQTPKLFRFLDAGYSGHDLVPLLDGFPASGVGAIQEAPAEEFRRDATRLSEVASIVGAPFVQMRTGVSLYLEPLAWAPINRVSRALQIFETIDRPNAKLCVDLWHFWASGDTPEDIATLPADQIAAVHVCGCSSPDNCAALRAAGGPTSVR